MGNYKIPIEEYSKIIDLYNSGNSMGEISKLYEVSSTTIKGILERNNVKIEPRFRKSQFSDEDIKYFLELYDKGLTLNEIAKMFGVTSSTIKYLFKKCGKKCRNAGQYNRKYKLNESFFDSIDTEEKAYIVGLLYADGYNNTKAGAIEISLQARDRLILEKIKTLLETDIPLIYYKSTSPTHQDYYKLIIHSRHISDQMVKLGMYRAKSLILDFPEWLDKEFYPSFLRGYFDRDGWVATTKTDYASSIVGTKNFCESVKLILDTLGIESKISYTHNKESATRNLIIYKRESTKKFLDYIYNDATIYLQRKYDVYKSKFCKNINNSLPA